jgi:hypothetical protein
MEKIRQYLKTPFGYKRIYSIEEFERKKKYGVIIPVDGEVYWAKNGMESSDNAFDTPQLDANQVVYYKR